MTQQLPYSHRLRCWPIELFLVISNLDGAIVCVWVGLAWHRSDYPPLLFSVYRNGVKLITRPAKVSDSVNKSVASLTSSFYPAPRADFQKRMNLPGDEI